MLSIIGNTILNLPAGDVPDFTYFTLEFYDPANDTVLTSGSVRPRYTVSGTPLEYSVDNGLTWGTVTSGTTVSVPSGRVVMRGSGRSALYTADGTSSAWTITPTTTGHLCRAYGNLNTLLDYNNPPLTLGYYAYAGMFSGCTSLSEPPALPAKIIGNYAYSYMFNGCTKLKFAPNIAAVEVGNYSCRDMFHNCTSMITPAGRLNADVLSPYCYQYMFWNCTSLITAPVLPASQLAPYCYRNMFEDCSALINAPPDLSALSLVDRCYQYMFLRCDSLVTAPEIMATHYETYCCYAMFEDCSSLKNMKVHLTTWGSGNTDYWLNRTATNGIFTCPAELPDTRGIGRIPTTWTKVDL